MKLPKVCVITCTAGRHTCIERSTGLFLSQTYKGKAVQLVFNNSEVFQRLDNIDLPDNKEILLVNKHSTLEGKRFTTLGEIYEEAIRFVPEDCEIISFWDDDDLFLPNHINEGVNGYLRALEVNKEAYKPSKSYYRDPGAISLVENTLEPSIFVKADIIYSVGFYNSTADQHLKWVNYLRDNDLLLVDHNGKPTLIYNWGDMIPTWKTSGDPDNPKNFENYRNFSKDHGDGIISPTSRDELTKYWKDLPK